MVSVKVLGALLLTVAVSCSLAAPVSVGEKTSVSFSSSRVSVKTSISQKDSRKDEPVPSQEDQPATVGESVLPVLPEEVNFNDKEDHVEGSGQPLSQNTVVEQRDLSDMDAAFSTHDFFGVLPGPYGDVIDDSGRGFFGDAESNPFKLYLS